MTDRPYIVLSVRHASALLGVVAKLKGGVYDNIPGVLTFATITYSKWFNSIVTICCR